MDKDAIVGIVGAGTMGAGIAQVAAAAGHRVLVYDARAHAATYAKTRIAEGLDGLVSKGRMEVETRDAILGRIEPVQAFAALAPAGLVVEAIVEDIEAKRALFAQLEKLCAEDTILASNTSSISITAIARDLQHKRRVAGLHFFNPAPIMKLVEIVSGLATAPEIAERLFALAQGWGKTPVKARSTPGFIVNRIARPFYAEALALLQERRATPPQIDACLRSAGFRMGPCELMDLIGHDVNFAVTQSVFEANFGDKRFVPSLVQRELVEGGMLGRKSGQGFYSYAEGAVTPAQLPEVKHQTPMPGAITVTGDTALSEALVRLLPGSARNHKGDPGLQVGKLHLYATDGRTATLRAKAEGHPEIGVFDWPVNQGKTLAIAFAAHCPQASRETGLGALTAAGFKPIEIGDAPGLIVARTVSMLINEASDAVQQGVCTADAADTAMKLGVNYPAGPFEWLAQLTTPYIVTVLNGLADATRSERYRVSPYLLEQ